MKSRFHASLSGERQLEW